MKNTSTFRARQPIGIKRIGIAALMMVTLFSVGMSRSANAALTDLSNRPLNGGGAAPIKPNIMLLLDTSNSMRRTHMPDELETTTSTLALGYKAFQCNILFYNPTQTYAIPRRADGTSFPTPSFTSAKYDGFNSGSANVNLSSSFKAFDNATRQNAIGEDPAQPAYYYLHSSTQILPVGVAPCTDVDTNVSKAATTSPSGVTGNWERKLVSSTSGPGATDERQNFANWYSFYRTRINLTKSSVSLAFAPLNDNYRVGFITVRPGNPVNSSAYLQIGDFNGTQRANWFDKLFTQIPGGASPAREGLARVGRHFGGKQDGINQGMAGDPIQFSCQKNFTIATTDGYWNTAAETVGPVQLDGTTLVGQQDNTLTADSGNTPRPIWDGTDDTVRVVTDKNNTYSLGACVGGYFNLSTLRNDRSTFQNLRSTAQIRQSTSQLLETSVQRLRRTTQNLASTAQTTLSTAQIRQSTAQNLRSTVQNLRSTTQITNSTIQRFQSTNQNLRSTNQNRQSTSRVEQVTTQFFRTTQEVRQSTVQNRRSTTQDRQSTAQRRQSTVQNLAATAQNLQTVVQVTQSTSQLVRNTAQRLQSTVQNRQTTTQNLQSTSQLRASTSQIARSTAQATASTSQLTRSTSQLRRSTTQILSCDAATELCTPVATCTVGGNITCQTLTTGPTLVATCTNAAASAGNTFVATSCANTTTGPTGVGSCTVEAANSGNAFTSATCNTVNTGPTVVSACTAAGAVAGNGFVATTCGSVNTGPTAVASCTAAGPNSGNSFTTTTCNTVSTGPTGVASCTAAAAAVGNSFTATTCDTLNTGPTGIASCVAVPAGNGNSFVATTCSTNNTTNIPVATCTAAGAISGNGFTTTTCPPATTTSNVPVQTCSPSSAISANSFTTTTCVDNNTGPTGVGSCTPATAVGSSWVTTTCNTLMTGPTGVASCTAAAAAAGNSFVATTCGNNNTTNVPVLTCAAASPTVSNGFATVTCTNANTMPTPVASCTPQTAASSNSFVTRTCSTNNTADMPVATCTASGAAMANSFVTTTCNDNNTTNVAVQSCTAAAAAIGNSFTATTCSTNNTTNVPVASCTASAETSVNSWTTTTCSTNNTTNVPVATCAASGPTSGNGFTTTTCVGPTILTGPTPFNPATCASGVGPGPGFIATLCTNTAGTAPVGVCTPQTESAGNNWTRIVCNAITTTDVPVVTCTPSGPTMANNFTTTTCPAPIVTTNVPVVTCTATGANAGNTFTSVTCPAPITTGPTAVASCTAAAAAAGNLFISTSCSNTTTGPTGAAMCTNVAPIALNSFVETICGTNNTNNVPVATCTAAAALAGNAFTTTSCPAPITTTDVPVQTCSPAAAAGGNSFVTTTCSTPNNTTNVPVATCTPITAIAGNNWVTTTCNTVPTGPTGVATCTPDPAAVGNTFIATTCGTNNTTNVPVASCSGSSPTAGNSFTTTTCPTPITTGPDAVANCSGGNAPQIAAAGNSWITRTCDTLDTNTNYADRPVASCTAQTAVSGNGFVTLTCPAPITTGPTPTASCTNQSATAGNTFVTTSCNTVNTGPTPVATCTAEGATAINTFTTATCSSAATGPTPVATCTPAAAAAGNSFITTSCNAVTTGPILTQTCAAAAASGANLFTQTFCPPVPGQNVRFVTTTTETTTLLSGGIVSATPTVVTTMSTIANVDSVCYTPGVSPGLPALPSPGKPGTIWTNGPGTNITLQPVPTAPCLTWPCTVNTTLGGSIGNTLADVAQYYYVTDLRPLMNNDVIAGGTGPEDDRVTHQHMATFAIGLGVSGELKYRADYRNVSTTTGDFADIRKGVKDWPQPLPDSPSSIDDFWHAAVNGRGQYFSAGDPASVINGLASALSTIDATLGSGSAAASSSTQEPTAGTNFAYVAEYVSREWTGDIKGQERNLITGDLTGTTLWSAKDLLEAKVGNACDNRKIFLFRNGATNNMVPFTWNSRECDGSGNPTGSTATDLDATEQANFNTAKLSLLSQYPSMTDGTSGTVNQRTPAAGANLVNFVRGQRGFEDFSANVLNKYYRKRVKVLGDIVNSQPTYVKGENPVLTYVDSGFASFKSSIENRTGMVYVGSNGGMLHAFRGGESVADVNAGKEEWSFIPTGVLPNLSRLADANYANNHIYTVDGTPLVFSAFINSVWRTVLVGGLRGGGKGYYALDVTDPLAPKALWEFNWGATCNTSGSGANSDCHVGFTYGKPTFGKLPDGTWAVFVSSGYNNVNSPAKAGDGQGYLYVLNAANGNLIHKIATGVGNASTPSGFAPLNVYADDPKSNPFALNIYGADLLGNVFRFRAADSYAVTRLGTAKDSSGTAQPVTSVMIPDEVNGKIVVMVGTGRLLGITDIPNTQTQSVYVMYDKVGTNPVYADVRVDLTPITLTAVGAGDLRTVEAKCSGTVATCEIPNGWYADFPTGGERVITNMVSARGVLTVATSLLDDNPCNSGGVGQVYQFSVFTGLSPTAPPNLAPGTASLVSTTVVKGLPVGVTVRFLQGGKIDTRITTSKIDPLTGKSEIKLGEVDAPRIPQGNRITWREITQ